MLNIFPFPLDVIARDIFNSADGSEEDKTNAVLGYFKNLEIQGKNHYNNVSTKLNNLLLEINDLKQITAKENTLQLIQEILISTGKETNGKLDILKNEIKQIRTKIDQIYEIGVDSNQRIKKIETRISPRHLTSQLISALENHLPKNKNEIILVSSMQGDADGYQFSDEIINYLMSKGWKVEPDIAIRSPPVYGLEIEKLSSGIHIWVGFNR